MVLIADSVAAPALADPELRVIAGYWRLHPRLSLTSYPGPSSNRGKSLLPPPTDNASRAPLAPAAIGATGRGLAALAPASSHYFTPATRMVRTARLANTLSTPGISRHSSSSALAIRRGVWK